MKPGTYLGRTTRPRCSCHHFWPRFGTLLLLAVLFGGCSGARHTRQAPDNLFLAIGKGGGFAGTWLGYSVYPDGQIQAWRGPVASRKGEPVGTLPPAALDSLWATLSSFELFGRKDDERGNLTGHIFAQAGGDSVSVWWPSGAPDTHPSAPLDSLYSTIAKQLGYYIKPRP